VHKAIKVIVISLLGLAMAACGSSSSPGNINGTWSATLVSSSNQSTAYTFSTTFTQSGGGVLTFTNFAFTSSGPCFTGDATSQTGSFALSGNSNGNVTGTLGMTITTEFPGGATQNVLNLQGNVSGNTITGTWTLTGVSGCSGNGTFTINRM
jgi:hypothetical protein